MNNNIIYNRVGLLLIGTRFTMPFAQDCRCPVNGNFCLSLTSVPTMQTEVMRLFLIAVTILVVRIRLFVAISSILLLLTEVVLAPTVSMVVMKMITVEKTSDIVAGHMKEINLSKLWGYLQFFRLNRDYNTLRYLSTAVRNKPWDNWPKSLWEQRKQTNSDQLDPGIWRYVYLNSWMVHAWYSGFEGTTSSHN